MRMIPPTTGEPPFSVHIPKTRKYPGIFAGRETVVNKFTTAPTIPTEKAAKIVRADAHIRPVFLLGTMWAPSPTKYKRQE